VTRPLVSVLTPTWGRHALLMETIENVRAQTYRLLEHVVVSDGEDDDLARWILGTQYRHESCGCDDPDYVPLRFIQLGRNWSSYLHDSFCAAPMTAAMLVARGDYQAWLADDERMTPDHIEGLVDALEATGADFAYGKVEMYRAESPDLRWVIGGDPPRLGQITNCLYRADLLKLGLFPFGAGMTSDWQCISGWQSKGARHAFVDRVTLTHRADH
jgi:glycosyltransferase involved in cell wall biosynthesis